MPVSDFGTIDIITEPSNVRSAGLATALSNALARRSTSPADAPSSDLDELRMLRTLLQRATEKNKWVKSNITTNVFKLKKIYLVYAVFHFQGEKAPMMTYNIETLTLIYRRFLSDKNHVARYTHYSRIF